MMSLEEHADRHYAWCRGYKVAQGERDRKGVRTEEQREHYREAFRSRVIQRRPVPICRACQSTNVLVTTQGGLCSGCGKRWKRSGMELGEWLEWQKDAAICEKCGRYRVKGKDYKVCGHCWFGTEQRRRSKERWKVMVLSDEEKSAIVEKLDLWENDEIEVLIENKKKRLYHFHELYEREQEYGLKWYYMNEVWKLVRELEVIERCQGSTSATPSL
jgi:hypothetical protein